MSWELMSETKEKCKCGKGNIIIRNYFDDWNRSKTDHILECKECKKKYNIKEKLVGSRKEKQHTIIEYEEKSI